jgi:hypothetical protein
MVGSAGQEVLAQAGTMPERKLRRGGRRASIAQGHRCAIAGRPEVLVALDLQGRLGQDASFGVG